MNRLDMTDVRCAVLFASGLQQSDAPTGVDRMRWVRQLVGGTSACGIQRAA